MSTPIQDSAPQDSAPEGRRDKVMAVFDKLGKLDQLGVVCVGLFVVSLVPSIVGIIALVIGAVLIALGGPKRRRVVLGVPRFIWYFGLSIYENWRHGEAEATRRHNLRISRRERRQAEQARQAQEDFRRYFNEEMTPEEFEEQLLQAEKDFEADGMSAQEIEAALTNIETAYAEALERRELVERRREARERRRAGVATSESLDDTDIERLNRMRSDFSERAEADERAEQEERERARQEEYEDLLAREEADIRREERESREEERREREEDRRVREEERRAREEEREERRRNR